MGSSEFPPQMSPQVFAAASQMACRLVSCQLHTSWSHLGKATSTGKVLPQISACASLGHFLGQGLTWEGPSHHGLSHRQGPPSPTLCKKAGWARHKEQARKQHSSIVCFTASLQPLALTSVDDGPQAVRINPFPPQDAFGHSGLYLNPGKRSSRDGAFEDLATSCLSRGVPLALSLEPHRLPFALGEYVSAGGRCCTRSKQAAMKTTTFFKWTIFHFPQLPTPW